MLGNANIFNTSGYLNAYNAADDFKATLVICQVSKANYAHGNDAS